MDLNSAIAAHGEWKLKFRAAIAKKEQLDAVTIGQDNRCALGQWLHGEAKGQYGGLQSHAHCLARHAEFHQHAGKVAQAINAGRYAEAEAMLGAGTPYTQVSSAVGSAIVALRKEARL
ncbi:MAG: CZB domain-containing protein [Burkholderiales bacterium]|nr:CZB domain-containing protein [Burkholderiales bacterium]